MSLGKFLEVSVAAEDIVASLAFYEELGFVQAQVGEAWAHPYAVVTDGRLCVGLHAASVTEPVLTWAAPGLAARVSDLAEMGLEFEHVRLDESALNEVVYRDPCGHLIRELEARTFSPPALAPGHESALGYFE